MFKNILRVAVQETFPPHTRGRPALPGFDGAYDDILRVVRTGMQWRYLRPTAAVAYITVFKTMHKWIDAGLFHTAYERLLRLYRRHRRPRYSCVDSTFVKTVAQTGLVLPVGHNGRDANLLGQVDASCVRRCDLIISKVGNVVRGRCLVV